MTQYDTMIQNRKNMVKESESKIIILPADGRFYTPVCL